MFSESIRHLRKTAGKTQQQVADELKINRSTLADYERGTYEPDTDKLRLFADYFGVSLDRLISKVASKPGSSLRDEQIRVLALTTDAQNRENIEYVPVKARAGYLLGYGDTTFISTLPRFHLPYMTSGTYRAFEISGDSMPPINNGFIAIGRYVENWQELKNDKRYILVTRSDGIVFKRIHKVETTGLENQGISLELRSDNPQYEPYSIPIEEVIEAWSFHSFIGLAENYLANPLDQILEKLGAIERKLENNIL